jgi:uncharacterized protein YqiB (DUF1249 family)
MIRQRGGAREAATVIKSSYKVDLRALHALCEANYARLLRLFPDYEACNARHFSVAAARVHIEVLERSRYTTLFRLRCYRASGDAGSAEAGTVDAGEQAGWLTPLKLEVRAYHDAGMLEVVTFQGGNTTRGRYSYPNPRMHQQDEKHQQNAFLADWLSHCLHHGEADMAEFLKPGAEHA